MKTFNEFMNEDDDAKHFAKVRKIYDAQHKQITKKYGKDAADNADYGHVVDGDEHGTKVRGVGAYIVSRHHNGRIVHSWEDDED